MSLDNSAGRFTLEDPESRNNEFNALSFMVGRLLDVRCTATLVRVVAVTNAGDVSPVGFVDVQPLVNQLDGQGVPVPHGVVHNLPYLRLQGGGNAVILDPVKDDIGLAVIADRDISSVKATKGVANPGSMRRADMADGLYIGGFLNGAPTQFVRFIGNSIELVSPSSIKLTTPVVQASANVSVGNGATGVFSTGTGQVVTVVDGIIVEIS